MSFPEIPDTDNYFAFYKLPIQFELEKSVLQEKYHQRSRDFHPDFFNGDQELYQKAVSLTAFNNLAYKTLQSDISRAEYLLSLKTDSQEEKLNLPQSFLMEMLELNERIDEAEKDEIYELEDEVDDLKLEFKEEIITSASQSNWANLRMALLKWRYIERLDQRLSDED